MRRKSNGSHCQRMSGTAHWHRRAIGTMNDRDPTATIADGDDSNCLLRTVADAMKDEPALEAVRIDRARRSVSVATLGKPRNADLERSLVAQIRQMEEVDKDQRCALFDGVSDCSTCPVPQSPEQRKKITIQTDLDSTTIARVTCPTAPTFWRWRELPWPK